MTRTTVVFPPDLKKRAQRKAKELGISFGALVRESLDMRLRSAVPNGKKKRDPLFADEEVYRGPVPSDLSERVDDYLYGEKS